MEIRKIANNCALGFMSICGREQMTLMLLDFTDVAPIGYHLTIWSNI